MTKTARGARATTTENTIIHTDAIHNITTTTNTKIPTQTTRKRTKTCLGEVEVDDDVDRLNVDPAREEVCCLSFEGI